MLPATSQGQTGSGRRAGRGIVPARVEDEHVQRSTRERERKSLGELASQLLARGLREDPEPQPGPFAWVSRDLGEPAVDLEDKEALASLLER
jgi:hypothetical protein